MAVPLPSPFLSPVFSPFSPPPDSNHHELHSEHHDSPRRKRNRVKSFTKHLASPFTSPSPSPAHLPQETGSPSDHITPLHLEHEPGPHLLRKRRSGNSVRSLMKTPPSPSSSSPSPFPSPDTSRLGPNPNHSNPEIDHNGSPIRKRERVRSFVKSIRSTSSQFFKKDKKDGESKKSTPAISALVTDSLGVSTAATAPNILRRFSHSKRPSMTSMTSATTTESELSTGYLEVKVGSGQGSLSSPIIEVDTPVSPTVVQPLDPTLMGQLKEEDMSPETEPKLIQSFPSLNDPGLFEPGSQPTQGPDPLQFPLPPSPAPSTSPIIDPFDSIQTPVNEREVHEATTGESMVPHEDVTPHDGTPPHDDNSPPQHDSERPSPSDQVQPPAPTGIAPTITPPHQTSRPHSPSEPAPGLDRDQEDQEMRDLCKPVLIPPMLFWPISNMHITYFFTPVLTWWLSKGVSSYPYLYS